MSRKYPTVVEGEWFEPFMKGYKDMCCDCGLVHKVNFRIVNGKVQMQVYRDNRATAATRRQRPR